MEPVVREGDVSNRGREGRDPVVDEELDITGFASSKIASLRDATPVYSIAKRASRICRVVDPTGVRAARSLLSLARYVELKSFPAK